MTKSGNPMGVLRPPDAAVRRDEDCDVFADETDGVGVVGSADSIPRSRSRNRCPSPRSRSSNCQKSSVSDSRQETCGGKVKAHHA